MISKKTCRVKTFDTKQDLVETLALALTRGEWISARGLTEGVAFYDARECLAPEKRVSVRQDYGARDAAARLHAEE